MDQARGLTDSQVLVIPLIRKQDRIHRAFAIRVIQTLPEQIPQAKGTSGYRHSSPDQQLLCTLLQVAEHRARYGSNGWLSRFSPSSPVAFLRHHVLHATFGSTYQILFSRCCYVLVALLSPLRHRHFSFTFPVARLAVLPAEEGMWSHSLLLHSYRKRCRVDACCVCQFCVHISMFLWIYCGRRFFLEISHQTVR